MSSPSQQQHDGAAAAAAAANAPPPAWLTAFMSQHNIQLDAAAIQALLASGIDAIAALQLEYGHALGAAAIASQERQARASVLLDALLAAKDKWVRLKRRGSKRTSGGTLRIDTSGTMLDSASDSNNGSGSGSGSGTYPLESSDSGMRVVDSFSSPGRRHRSSSPPRQHQQQDRQPPFTCLLEGRQEQDSGGLSLAMGLASNEIYFVERIDRRTGEAVAQAKAECNGAAAAASSSSPRIDSPHGDAEEERRLVRELVGACPRDVRAFHLVEAQDATKRWWCVVEPALGCVCHHSGIADADKDCGQHPERLAEFSRLLARKTHVQDGSVSAVLCMPYKLRAIIIRDWLEKVLLHVKTLHDKGVTCWALKPRNILLDSKGEIHVVHTINKDAVVDDNAAHRELRQKWAKKIDILCVGMLCVQLLRGDTLPQAPFFRKGGLSLLEWLRLDAADPSVQAQRKLDDEARTRARNNRMQLAVQKCEEERRAELAAAEEDAIVYAENEQQLRGPGSLAALEVARVRRAFQLFQDAMREGAGAQRLDILRGFDRFVDLALRADADKLTGVTAQKLLDALPNRRDIVSVFGIPSSGGDASAAQLHIVMGLNPDGITALKSDPGEVAAAPTAAVDAAAALAHSCFFDLQSQELPLHARVRDRMRRRDTSASALERSQLDAHTQSAIAEVAAPAAQRRVEAEDEVRQRVLRREEQWRSQLADFTTLSDRVLRETRDVAAVPAAAAAAAATASAAPDGSSADCDLRTSRLLAVRTGRAVRPSKEVLVAGVGDAFVAASTQLVVEENANNVRELVFSMFGDYQPVVEANDDPAFALHLHRPLAQVVAPTAAAATTTASQAMLDFEMLDAIAARASQAASASRSAPIAAGASAALIEFVADGAMQAAVPSDGDSWNESTVFDVRVRALLEEEQSRRASVEGQEQRERDVVAQDQRALNALWEQLNPREPILNSGGLFLRAASASPNVSGGLGAGLQSCLREQQQHQQHLVAPSGGLAVAYEDAAAAPAAAAAAASTEEEKMKADAACRARQRDDEAQLALLAVKEARAAAEDFKNKMTQRAEMERARTFDKKWVRAYTELTLDTLESGRRLLFLERQRDVQARRALLDEYTVGSESHSGSWVVGAPPMIASRGPHVGGSQAGSEIFLCLDLVTRMLCVIKFVHPVDKNGNLEGADGGKHVLKYRVEAEHAIRLEQKHKPFLTARRELLLRNLEQAKQRGGDDKSHIAAAQRKLDDFDDAQHPLLIGRTHGAYFKRSNNDEKQRELVIFMEMLHGGVLSDIIQRFDLRELQIRNVVRDMLLSLALMHEPVPVKLPGAETPVLGGVVVHDDIGMNNAILCPDGRTRLIDFGESVEFYFNNERGRWVRREDEAGVANVGRNPVLQAPERGGERAVISPKGDVWSLGMVLLELLTKQQPFRNALQIKDIVYKADFNPLSHPFIALYRDHPQRFVKDAESAAAKRGATATASQTAVADGDVDLGSVMLDCFGRVSPECRDFIRRCVAPLRRNRSTAKELLEHAWITMPASGLRLPADEPACFPSPPSLQPLQQPSPSSPLQSHLLVAE